MFFPQGSYYCGGCKPGFVGNGYLGCKPGDFCQTGAHNCHSLADCISLAAGKFICKVSVSLVFDIPFSEK